MVQLHLSDSGRSWAGKHMGLNPGCLRQAVRYVITALLCFKADTTPFMKVGFLVECPPALASDLERQCALKGIPLYHLVDGRAVAATTRICYSISYD